MLENYLNKLYTSVKVCIYADKSTCNDMHISIVVDVFLGFAWELYFSRPILCVCDIQSP